jgi:hypothetical protein
MSSEHITVLAVVIILLVPFLFLLQSYLSSKSALNRLIGVIDGSISKKPMRGGPQRCLVGSWRGLPVEAFLEQSRWSAEFFVTLYAGFSIPCSTIFILPVGAGIISGLIMGDVNTFLHGSSFEIPEFNIKLISDTADRQQLLDFISPQRLKIINCIFSRGFNVIEIHQQPSDSYIRFGYQSYDYLLPGLDRIIDPLNVEDVLKLIKDF